ncbi:hypothetical protein TWF106_001625 [Orbilia oligospora]|uniref:Uncharacterized protein n=1 Tax=Orbilia oligospora TaxID=2813651 RepID=A0A6G1M0U9_ORBOL|nr:hypothetical protein TWF106_001625 [Orbilia oligospora]KAF3230988.1 hypothetical protein TWF191_007719 [Orbilia oligospora]KAF3241014.1 hypothetical protein TWF192_009269 [Orbilia oligospora]
MDYGRKRARVSGSIGRTKYEGECEDEGEDGDDDDDESQDAEKLCTGRMRCDVMGDVEPSRFESSRVELR